MDAGLLDRPVGGEGSHSNLAERRPCRRSPTGCRSAGWIWVWIPWS